MNEQILDLLTAADPARDVPVARGDAAAEDERRLADGELLPRDEPEDLLVVVGQAGQRGPDVEELVDAVVPVGGGVLAEFHARRGGPQCPPVVGEQAAGHPVQPWQRVRGHVPAPPPCDQEHLLSQFLGGRSPRGG